MDIVNGSPGREPETGPYERRNIGQLR
jgi:hypothetical protein